MEKETIMVELYINTNCDLCKVMQHELMNHPPKATLRICYVGRDENSHYKLEHKCKTFPTTFICSYPSNTIIDTFEGFVSSEIIDKAIKEYENK